MRGAGASVGVTICVPRRTGNLSGQSSSSSSSAAAMSNTALLQRIRDPQPPTPILVCSKVALCVIPIAQIAIGAVHLHDCPRQPYILPVYLIVMGVFGLVLSLLSCLPCARQAKDEPTNPLSRVCTVWNSLTSFFLFCWFIAGNVWIYSIYEPNYNKNATDVGLYCNKTLYLFAFWTTTLMYIFLALFLVGGCCVLVCFFLLGRADPDDV